MSGLVKISWLLLVLALLLPAPLWGAALKTYDVVIYGGTSAGIAAAVQAKRMGKTVVIIEPGNRLGGMTTGGLGQTDIGNKKVIGGIAREFYRAVKAYYDDPLAWKWQPPPQHKSDDPTQAEPADDAKWTFEPSVALKIYQGWIKRDAIDVAYGERLDRSSGVVKTGASPSRIESLIMESGHVYSGQMFIDASYEGDLMAAASVSYIVGREANAQYKETYDGVEPHKTSGHQLMPKIDPFISMGDVTSGLLPFIDPTGPGIPGSADKRVQAYCYRMCLTMNPENQIPFAKPEGYQDSWYELLFRNFAAGQNKLPLKISPMPNLKTDTNNDSGVSTDFIGQNYAYPESSYADRAKIAAQHLLYQQGLMWTLANDTRVPDPIRAEAAKWGLCKDEFTESGGWPTQLYIREARRLVGAYVMTQKNCSGKEKVADGIGMAAYTMDSHNTQRYVDIEGFVKNEGDIEVKGSPPYPISYRAIIPKADECPNLLVPVCLSASHIAYGSIRMEPVFMVLGQSAATAAVLAIDSGISVQQVDYFRLKEALKSGRQVLTGGE